MNAETRQEVRLALLADIHFHQGERGQIYLHHLERIIADVKRAGVEAILVAGDLTEHGDPVESAGVRNLLEATQVPVMVVPGNHDVGNKRLPEAAGHAAAAVTVNRIADYESCFGKCPYSRDVAGLRVIGLNSQLFGSGFAAENEQWQLLEREFCMSNSPTILVLLHMPPYLESPDEPGDPYWNIEPRPRQRFFDLLARSSVKAVLSGHLHRPVVRDYRDIKYITSPPVSFGLPEGMQPEGWTLLHVSPGGDVQPQFFHIS